VDATIIAAIHGSHANRAGRFSRDKVCPVRQPNAGRHEQGECHGLCMPRGRSTFTERPKEHTRQQRQRDKAERRNQRKQEKAVAGSVHEMAELHQHGAEQPALFDLGVDEVDTEQKSPSSITFANSSYFPGLGVDAVTGKLTVLNVAYK
jgi:hypothetical protein